MTFEYERPLEVVIGMKLQRTDASVTGPYAERLNAMVGNTYNIVSVYPREVFLENIDATRAAAEGVIRLAKTSVTPSKFAALPPGS
ncbi:hypothetical protein A3C37_05425 [Candidatus Peribacteria bacterium RIFCSPHIGHO2_02_FULL_53_20]|nr:MAG: hypothetical protein A3C37_05425 [Candidatus Peribacteria bacterium RIFCSPHIGHO2_02_FULL_53_20]OGJ67634.1 MAG: hypothetical protein A3B61_02140 [Candidatus Peribacteria bacterium RIFCSPLOWO2_01_FULL_53_10]OGJ69480.1 MAG: hypothetical protein A3G69_00475 [Candidatus Peribacteria bacterium RIFCSPLOWO2_12_FULL_53_10]